MLKYLAVIFLLPLTSFAQTSGDIFGIVTEAKTGNVLSGVSLKVEGLGHESKTNEKGLYRLFNVPVGEYNMQVGHSGHIVLIRGVRVFANVATKKDILLGENDLVFDPIVEEAIAIEPVTITAIDSFREKPYSHYYSVGSSKFLATTPVKDLNSILDIFPAVVVQDDNIHIRGGRAEEVGYYLDGSNVSNPVSNTNGLYVIQDAVQQIQVLTGGYAAEFGGANSGIVQSKLKTGGKDYNFSLDFQTDNFADKGNRIFNTYSYQDHFLTFTASGPILSDNIRFFAAVENSFIGDTKKRFSKGFDFTGLGDQNILNPTANPDTVNLSYFDGFTPGNEQTQWALNGTLLFDYSPFQFRLSVVSNFKEQYFSNEPMLEILNDRSQYSHTSTNLITGKFTHNLSLQTYYDLKISYYKRHFEDKDDWFGNNWKLWSDSAAISNYTGGAVTYRSAFRAPYDYQLGGIYFDRRGKLKDSAYDIDQQQYFGGAFNFTSQLNKEHQLKVGGDIRSYTIRNFSINPSVMEALNGQPIESVDISKWGRFINNHYGYDEFGKEIDSGFNGSKEPVYGSFYVQDKIEYKDIIVNAGLRLDYFDSDDRKLKDPGSPEIYNPSWSVWGLDESAWKDLDPFVKVNPRLAVSFAGNENTVFYATYSKFSQMPELNNSYFGLVIFDRQITSGGNFYINPIGFGLKPIHSELYEVGMRKHIGENLVFNITGFYKNTKEQLKVDRIIPSNDYPITAPYNYVKNGGFSNSRGFDFQLQVKGSSNLNAIFNYTFTAANGTGSDEFSYLGTVDRNAFLPSLVRPLDFVQKQQGNFILDYRFTENGGGPIFKRFGANLLFSFNSGHPFTLSYHWPGGHGGSYASGVDYMLDTRGRQPEQPINTSTTPWFYSTDLKLDKTFKITEDISANVYMRVKNLFNNKNVINVYQATGSAKNDGVLIDPDRSGHFIKYYGSDYVEMYKAINTQNGQAYLDLLGKELYGHPRQIMFGIKLVY